METPDGERPVSYSSTSSSSSSRDSRCSSLAPSCTAVPEPDTNAGEIRLELVPAQQLDGADDQPNDGRHGHAQTSAAETPAAEATAEPAGPKPQYVDRVVQEILDTERTYVQDLKSIVQDYMGCSSSQARLGLGAEEKSALFGNIQDIYNFNRSVAVLTEFMRNKALAKFFRERQEFLNHSLPLSSYLLKPVQRILKYHLLLHEIANHLNKQTDGYEVVLEAIDTMQRVACHINDMKRKHEHAVRLQEIQSLLMNWKGPDLISYGELVLEGTFRIQRAKNERTLFLLERLLLITKKREESYTYKAHILCCNLMLVEVIPKEPLSFSVFHYKNPKLQHTVQAKSQQDKRMWILQLKRLILENHPAKIPAKVSPRTSAYDVQMLYRLEQEICSPGLLYSPQGDRKSQIRDGPTTRRVRRKSGKKSHRPAELRQAPVLCNQSLVAMVTGEDLVRNIWTDHQIRHAMFPTRQKTIQVDDEEDIYQMFVLSEPSDLDMEASQVTEGSRVSGRPCSWHMEQTQQEYSKEPGSGGKVLRRASSVGEKNSSSKESDPEDKQSTSRNSLQIDSSSSVSGSSEHLTIDDIENVYDNISYEDLKSMGLIHREPENPHKSLEAMESKPGQKSKEQISISRGITELPHSSDDKTSSFQDALPVGTTEPEVEENIYDTIGFLEQPVDPRFCYPADTSKQSLILQSDSVGHDSLGRFISEDHLQSGEENHWVSSEMDSSSTSNSHSLLRTVTAVKMSEQVDEIWNDLENYIKKNEKKQERLTAAFPVNGQDSPRKTLGHDPARRTLGQDRVRDPHEKRALLGLSGSLFPRDFVSFDNTLDSSDSIFSDSMDFPLEIGDRTKNRVFLMARQYSQKIKKANQLLKTKNPEQEQAVGRLKSKQKDLADILEEKKQGGAAIGKVLIVNRIAEYSQLYEQVVFKEMPSSSQKNPQSTHQEPSESPQSQHLLPLTPEGSQMPSGLNLDEDWLNSTYSNGELIDFITCFKESELKEDSLTIPPQTKLTPASPTEKCPAASQFPAQRWSACMAQTDRENLNQEQVFNSLGRHAPPYSGKNADQHGKENGSIPSTRSSMGEMTRGSAFVRLGLSGRQYSLPDQFMSDHRDVTLQDSRQVLAVGRSPPMNAFIATQNYHANFKDNSDDDDDYVEIRSEDEELDSSRQHKDSQAMSAPRVDRFSHGDLRQSLSLPCTPIKSSPGASATAFVDQDKPTQYLWNEPQVSQQNLVQSLREKFHCLSSSSFA
uniref:Pleckstrin homology and RhoGEF domain containing G1 n=1 Tax=Scleropages formosus TaxID=113540 RepID=A0A8C9VC20_SCLFO